MNKHSDVDPRAIQIIETYLYRALEKKVLDEKDIMNLVHLQIANDCRECRMYNEKY